MCVYMYTRVCVCLCVCGGVFGWVGEVICCMMCVLCSLFNVVLCSAGADLHVKFSVYCNIFSSCM